MSRDDARSDGVYSDQTTGGPYGDAFENDGSRGTSAVPYGSAYTPGWWPLRSGDDEEAAYSDDGDPRSATDSDAGTDDRANEELISLFLLVGVILFLIPEPVTSTIGIVLVLAGVAAWIADALR